MSRPDRDTWQRRTHPEARRLGEIIASAVRERRRTLEQPEPPTEPPTEPTLEPVPSAR